MTLCLKKLSCTCMLLIPSTFSQAKDLWSTDQIKVTGNVTMATDYRFRGLSLNNNDPTIQGGINFNHQSGAYLGLWASNADVGAGGNIEADFFVGYILPFSENTYLDLSYADVNYPGTLKEAKTDFNEFAVVLNHSGSLTAGDKLTAGVYYSPNFSFDSGKEFYVNSSYSLPIADSGVNLFGAVGFTQMEDKAHFDRVFLGTGTQDSYLDYKIALNGSIQGITAEVAWIDNTVKSSNSAMVKSTVLFSLSKPF